jgi:type IX secretion system PorP/SprF family membrane protein
MGMLAVNKRQIILLTIIFIQVKVFAQDAQFSQFYSNKMYLAPSFVGSTQQQRVSSSVRDQWPGLANPYLTYTLSYEHYFPNFNSGVGVLFLRDEAGAGHLGNTNIGLQYSYSVRFFQTWYFRPGLSILYTQRSIDFNNLVFIDGLATNSTSKETSTSTPVKAPDFSTSVLVYNNLIWVGASLDHLLTPNQSFYGDEAKVPIKTSIFGGMQIIKRGKLLNPIDETVSLAFLYKNQDYKNQLDIGLYWNKSPLVLGLWYRGIPFMNWNRADAVALLVGLKTKKFNIGYSYDFTVSHLISNSAGAHEISLSYEFKTSRKKKIHSIPCPEF